MSARELEVRIDREACRGTAECTVRAPATFTLDADGKAVASDPPGDLEEAISSAARACPRFAITLIRSTKAEPPREASSH